MRRPLVFALVLALSATGAWAGVGDAMLQVAPVTDISSAKVFPAGANAAEVESLASWSETVIAIGKPLSAERFNILADAAGVPRASRQDTLRKFNITHEESGSERMFFVREGGSPKRTDIGFLEGKPEGFAVYLMNQRGDLKWAGRGNEDEGYVPTPLRDAREPFAVELGFWQGFEEAYNELNAVAEDGS